MDLSSPIDLSRVASRRDVQAAMREVWNHGDRAPGSDGKRFNQVFGAGPTSRPYRRTENRLLKARHALRLHPPRRTKIFDLVTGQDRELTLCTVKEQVLFRGLTSKLRPQVPLTPVNCSRPGVDARWSVMRVAVALRTERLVVQRVDVQRAFDSINWKAVMGSPRTMEFVPEDIRRPLVETLQWFAPSGVGVPTGLSFSPLVLDLACVGLDRRLADMPVLACRYLDDVVVLASNRQRAERAVQIIEEELQQFGLQPHPDKTRLYTAGAFPWLGHELDLHGMIDVAEEPARRLLAGPRYESVGAQWTAHFVLARSGRRFKETVAAVMPSATEDQKEKDPAAGLLAELAFGKQPPRVRYRPAIPGMGASRGTVKGRRP
jgi:hypothetical protein